MKGVVFYARHAQVQLVGVDRGNMAQRIRQGTEHMSALKEDHLQQLAQETGLQYQRLATAQDLTEVILAAHLAYYQNRDTELGTILASVALFLLVLVYISDLFKTTAINA